MLNMTRLHVSLAMAAAIALGLSACAGGSDSEPSDTRTEPDVAETESAESPPSEGESADTEAPTTDGNSTVDAGRCGVIVGDGEYEPIACGEPHDAEFAGTASAPTGADSVSLMIACAPSVEALTGRPQVEFGIDVGVAVIDGAAEVECWAESAAPGSLSASILDDGLEAAIGEYSFITDLADGTCFRLADPEAFDLGVVVDCDTPDAEMIYGQFEADDGPVPDEATDDGFFERCDAIEAATDFDVIGNSRYIVTPLDDNWVALGRRTVLCMSWTDPLVQPVDEPSDFDPAAAVGPVCADYDEAVAEYEPVPCDEPHTSEYAGSVPPPPGDLPSDSDEASLLLRGLCRDSVEALTGRDLGLFGSGVGFLSIDGLGEPMVNDIQCYLSVSYEGALTGAISEIGYEAALNYDIIPDLEPGTCFVYVEPGSYDLGESAPCDTPDALMAIGLFLAEDPPGAPYPGDDALRALRGQRCAEVLTASGLTVDESTLSGTFPNETNWIAFDRRTITCDAVPL